MISSKRSKSSIMCNPGFGDVVIIKEEFKITVPQSCLDKKGHIPAELKNIINSRLTIDDAVAIHREQGIVIEKANNNLLGGM